MVHGLATPYGVNMPNTTKTLWKFLPTVHAFMMNASSLFQSRIFRKNYVPCKAKAFTWLWLVHHNYMALNPAKSKIQMFLLFSACTQGRRQKNFKGGNGRTRPEKLYH